jgi:PAS domain S-box-containing protein
METPLFRRTLAPRSAWRRIRPYVFAVASCALALGLTLPLYPYLDPAPRLLLFFAVVASSRFGGLGPGVFATALATFLGGELPVPPGVAQNEGSLAAFGFVCLVSVAVVSQLRSRALALRDKEEQLIDFMENATVGLHWMAADGTVLWANETTGELLNCASAGGCVGRKFQAFCASAEEATDILRRLAGNERLKNYEIRLRARDGSPRVALLDANVLWSEGRFIHARCFLRDITARKQAELAVQENTAKFRAVFDQSIDSIVMIKDGRLCMANPAFLKLFGYGDIEALAGKGVLDMIAPAFRPQVREYIERRARGDSAPFQYETRGARRDGTEFDMEVSASAFLLHGQMHTLAIVRDVTERLRAEETIAQERNLLRTVIDAVPDCIYTKDTEGRFLISNLANVRLLGAGTEAEVHGRSVLDLCPPEYARPFVEDDQRVIGTGQPLFNRVESFLRPDGEERTFLTAKLPLRNGAGEVLGLAGISRDITESKRGEAALRESEHRYRQLIHALSGAVYTCDAQGRITLFNEAAAALWGRRPEIGRDRWCGSWRIYAQDGSPLPQEECPMAIAIREGRPVRGTEIVIERPDGSRSFVLPHPDPIRDASGAVVGAVNMLVDLTDRKQAEEAIRELNEALEARVQERTRQLEQANRELEAFSYSISHDLRAPVRAISGFAQIIHEDHSHQLEGEVARLFKVISTSARRMGELIDDLLAFSRLNAQEPERLPVDMTALAQSVLAEQLRDRRESQASIRLTDLPEAVGDESMLRQVLTNLVSNALKFSGQASTPTVEIGARREGEDTTYYVRDNGVGFDMKYAPKLFKVFQRLHNVEQFDGTGVGLAIVQRIIQRHGGQVWAESQPGEGATFFFSLPVLNSSGVPPANSGPLAATAEGGPQAALNGSSVRHDHDASPVELGATEGRSA